MSHHLALQPREQLELPFPEPELGYDEIVEALRRSLHLDDAARETEYEIRRERR